MDIKTGLTRKQEYAREYRKNNPDIIKAANKRYRARKNAIENGKLPATKTITKKALIQKQYNRIVYLESKLKNYEESDAESLRGKVERLEKFNDFIVKQLMDRL